MKGRDYAKEDAERNARLVRVRMPRGVSVRLDMAAKSAGKSRGAFVDYLLDFERSGTENDE